MTLKVFRDAYLATKTLRRHTCPRCRRGETCTTILDARRAVDKADRLLGLKETT